MLRIPLDNLDVMPTPAPWGAGRWSYNGIPFTGVTYEYWHNTQILNNESEHVDGYIEGLQREYHQNGQLKSEYYSKNGHVYRYVKEWNENGNLVYHVEYDDFGNETNAILY